MQDTIKKTRVKIDGLAQLVKELTPFKGTINAEQFFDGHTSTELLKAYDSLILGKAWLGKVLGELGTESPYSKDGTRHSVEDIEKAADVEKDKDWVYGAELNHIEKVDYLREAIDKICREILPMSPNGTWKKRFLFEQWAHKHLSEARFWLGFELQRIKENR